MKIIYENGRGERTDFSKGKIRAVKAEGTSAYADVSSTESAFFSGAGAVSSRMGVRKIRLTLAVCSKNRDSISALSDIADTENQGRLIFDSGVNIKEIGCYVEKISSADGDFMTVEMSFVCPSPFFEKGGSDGRKGMILCGTMGMLEFDWELDGEIVLSDFTDEDSVSVINGGASAVGCVINVEVLRRTENIRIANADTKEHMELCGVWESGSRITIDTRHGCKGICCTADGAVYENVISRLKWGSSFLQLIPGSNRIYVRTDGGTECLSADISFTERYGGL